MRLLKNRSLFSSITRNTKFSPVLPKHLQYFQSILPQNEILTGQYETALYNQCYLKSWKGTSQLVLKPSTTKQVSDILKYCNQNMLAVVPQGGNTGLVGGSVPAFDEVILSLKNMNKVQKFDPISSVLSCETGCVLQKLNQYLYTHGYEIPLDLGAKGSCLIGSNASTHAGGKYFIKHGPLRAHILGLEVVLADGTILDMRSTIRKDNTGYDLKQLFIGAEGTLGIITKLDINCVKVDQNKQVILLKTKDYKKILEAVEISKRSLGKNLNAIEYMDGYAYSAVTKHLHPSVMDVKYEDQMLLLEVTTQQIQNFLSQLPQFDQSIMSTNEKQYKSIWKIREDIAEAANKVGLVHSFDVSFNVREWFNMTSKLRQTIKDSYVIGYGHIGDGNLHINICVERGRTINEEQIFLEVLKNKGSISAEHGIGIHKPEFLRLQKSKSVLDLCTQIRHVFDKNGILNPYKVHV